MANLYEILEVSEKASKEVIDKAYHVLAKKYHPDLQQTQEKKRQAEVKMKKINEAYNILGNEQKRKIYDLKLKQEIEEQNRINKQKQLEELNKYKSIRQNTTENIYGNYQNQYTSNRTQREDNVKRVQNGLLDSYKQLYNNYFEKRRSEIRQPWTWNRTIDLLKVLAIIAIIIIVLLLFPPTNKLIVGLYENNPAIKTVGDIIGQIFFGIVNGIITFFKNIVLHK